MTREISSFLRNFLMQHRNDEIDVLEFTIDYNESANESSGMVPYLNIYLGNLTGGNVKEALQAANKKNDFDAYYDLIDRIDESEFELELSSIINPEKEDKTGFTAVLREVLKSNKPFTKNIKTIFFHYVDEFDIVYF